MDEGLNYLQTFNPTESKPDLLEHTLVGRKDLVDRLEQLVIESANSGNKLQRLIIGPRGSGKTHTFKVLHNRISKNTGLVDKLEIAYLCEDEYGVATFLDWIVRILRSFIRWDTRKAAYLEDKIEIIKRTPSKDQEKLAVQILLEHIKNRTVLIIVENIGDVFHKKKGFGKKGQQKFRDLLQQYPYFTIMASSQALFSDLQKEDMPFHNFFKIIHLKKLSFEDSLTLLNLIAQWDKDKKFIAFLNSDEGRSQIRAIYDLIGGNHRLLVTFYNFLKTDYIYELSESFMKTINDLIPYYQSMMDILTSQQQKIVQYMCQTRNAVNVKTIAENCFSAQNTISSQLKKLVTLKYVDAIRSGRETYYELAEPLLRICNEVKENRGGPVKLFVDFLGNLYSAEEIKQRFMKFHILSKNSEGWSLLGQSQEELENIEEAKKSCLKAIELDENNYTAIALYSSILIKDQAIDEAQEYLSRLPDEFFENSHALNIVGEAYRENALFKNAVPIYTQAIKADPEKSFLYFNLISCAVGLNDIESALHHLEDAMKTAVKLKLTDQIIQCFEENFTTLFLHASFENISCYPEEAMGLIEEYSFTDQFNKSIPETVFNLLKRNEEIEINRFEAIEKCMQDLVKENRSIIVPLKFFNIGIRHFKKNEKNVLMKFTKEERATFNKFILDSKIYK